MPEKTRMSFRVPRDIEKQIEGFTAASGLTKTDALLELIKTGLAVKNDGPYISELAQITRDTMRAELGAFERTLEDAQDDLFDILNQKLDAAVSASFASMLAAVDTLDGNSDDQSTMFQSAGRYMAYGFDREEALSAAVKHRKRVVSKSGPLLASLWD